MAEKEKILVVDDEPSIRKYLQTLLEVDGFDVEAVNSGREALNRVKKGERPDFIILDVLMPEMNGIDTLDRKSTRLNSSHEWISYAVFCLKKIRKTTQLDAKRMLQQNKKTVRS